MKNARYRPSETDITIVGLPVIKMCRCVGASLAIALLAVLLFGRREGPPAERDPPVERDPPAERDPSAAAAGVTQPDREEPPAAAAGVKPDSRSTFAALGGVERKGQPPPQDLQMWLPALREVLARDGDVLTKHTPALAVRRLWARGESDGCHGRGQPDQLAGVCLCRAGYGGDACQYAAPQRCNDDRPRCVSGGAGCQDCLGWHRCSLACGDTRARGGWVPC